ncbi:hypothetical protein L218DRAFT_1066992 [Marasmius fiardii PR-910]|nr:hypothetical protein L218DRAFT_1066992 [Marasmius fiardii PR-910]
MLSNSPRFERLNTETGLKRMTHQRTIRKVRSCSSIPANNLQAEREFTQAEVFRLANTVGGALIKSQSEQYSENPVYGMLNAILSQLMFLVKPDVPEHGDRFLVCPQLRRIPRILGQRFSLATITSTTPDLDVLLMNVFKLSRQLVILAVEAKRLTWAKNGEESEEQQGKKKTKGKGKDKGDHRKEEHQYVRRELDWTHLANAMEILKSEFVTSLEKLFMQAICTFACNSSQESESSDHRKYTINKPIQIGLILKLFPHPVTCTNMGGESSNPSQNQEGVDPGPSRNPITPNSPKIIRYEECIFKDLKVLTDNTNVRWPPELSDAFRTLLRYILTKYNLHWDYHSYYALSEATYQPNQDVLEEAQMLIEEWYQQKYFQQDIDDAMHKQVARPTGSFIDTPQRDLQTDRYIMTPEKLPKHLREPEESPGYETPSRGTHHKNDFHMKTRSKPGHLHLMDISKPQRSLAVDKKSEDSEVEEDPEDDSDYSPVDKDDADSDNDDDMYIDDSDSDADDGSDPFDAGF